MPISKPLLALALAGFATTATAQSAPSAPPAAAARASGTTIGRSDHELILAKVAVTDLARSYDFYTRVLGLKLASPMLQPPKATDPAKDFAEYPLNFTGSLADPFFVITKTKGQVVTPEGAANTVIGIKVPNAQAAVARAVAAGARAVGRAPGPGPMAFGTIVDPDGYHIEFVQAARSPAK